MMEKLFYKGSMVVLTNLIFTFLTLTCIAVEQAVPSIAGKFGIVAIILIGIALNIVIIRE